MFWKVRTVCATFVTYVCLKLWGTSFPVSVSVQLQPIVSGIGRQHGISLTPLIYHIYRTYTYTVLSTVSAALAQPTFNRSACRSPTSLVGHISALSNVMICWFLASELSLADGVCTLQLQSSGTHIRHGCTLPPGQSRDGLKTHLFLQVYTWCCENSNFKSAFTYLLTTT